MGWLTQLLKGKKVAGKAVKTYTPTKHEKFMMKDPYERAAIISKRKSAERGDVYTGTSVVGTPSPHRSAKAIKKYSGPRSYQLTDPKRRGPHAKGGRIGFKQGGAYGPLRGTSGPKGVAKSFRGKEGFKESQALQKKFITADRNISGVKSPVTYTKPSFKRWKKSKTDQYKRKQTHVEAGKQRLQAKYPDFKFKNKGGKV